jgi:hypothetical protein
VFSTEGRGKRWYNIFMSPRQSAAAALLLTSSLFAADSVTVQTASQIPADLRGSAPTVQVQEAARISEALNAYTKSSLPADPGRILGKDEEIERIVFPSNKSPWPLRFACSPMMRG